MRVCLCSAAASSKGKKGAVASGGNLTTAAPIPGFRLQWPQKMVPALNPINYRYITGVDRLPPCPRVSMMQFVVAFSCGCSKLLSVFFFFFFFKRLQNLTKVSHCLATITAVHYQSMQTTYLSGVLSAIAFDDSHANLFFTVLEGQRE